jgi:hypothetical protein
MSTGRPATLPESGYLPPQRLFCGPDECLVRFYPEQGGDSIDLDLSTLPVERELREWIAHAVAGATGPGGTRRTLSSARSVLPVIRSFTKYLASLQRPPVNPRQLRPAHVDGFILRGGKSLHRNLSSLRSILRFAHEPPEAFWAHLNRAHSPKIDDRLISYSEAEFARITSAARADLRAAAVRIGRGRTTLAAWRAGQSDPAVDKPGWETGWLLDHVDLHGDVPRLTDAQGRTQAEKWVSNRPGGVRAVTASLYPTCHDIGAAAVLLICLTGQNSSTIATLTTEHLRPDGHAGGTATALVDMLKPRRGSRNASMSAPLQDVSADGTNAGTGRTDLSTPFGVFSALLDLGSAARARCAGEGLFAHYNAWGGPAGPRGFHDHLPYHSRRLWGERASVDPDGAGQADATTTALRIDGQRLRLTWLEIHQKPVAQTTATLANEYLARNRGNLVEYQQVVARVLDEQVAQARSRPSIPVLTEDDVRMAATDPAAVAARYGLDTNTLAQLLNGQLDTVLAGCADHHAGPFGPVGDPCSASFLLCLSCPCARATPAHLPIQVLVHDGLLSRRDELTPLRWAERFAEPSARLQDLLEHFPRIVIDEARASATGADHALVQRFLSRGLDST